jgi:hypothetical protein
VDGGTEPTTRMEAFAVLGKGAGASAFIGRGPGRFLGKEDESGREGQKAWARGEERNDVVSLTCGIRNAPVRAASPTPHTDHWVQVHAPGARREPFLTFPLGSRRKDACSSWAREEYYAGSCAAGGCSLAGSQYGTGQLASFCDRKDPEDRTATWSLRTGPNVRDG